MKSVYIPKKIIDESLANSPTQGKHTLDPLKALTAEHGVPFNILENHETTNEAEIHTHAGDLWHCIEGEVTFVTGGELVKPWVKKNNDGTENPKELKASEIRGGAETVLKPGDWLWIPASEAHQHKCAGTARLAIIKTPAA